MILNEETFDILNFDVPDVANADIELADMDSTVPEAGPEVGVETLLMQAIKDVYGMIEGYNSLSIALTDIGNEPAAISVADIIKMEHANIGVLQDILSEVSPNAEAVGINESLNEDMTPEKKRMIILTMCSYINEALKALAKENIKFDEKTFVEVIKACMPNLKRSLKESLNEEYDKRDNFIGDIYYDLIKLYKDIKKEYPNFANAGTLIDSTKKALNLILSEQDSLGLNEDVQYYENESLNENLESIDIPKDILLFINMDTDSFKKLELDEKYDIIKNAFYCFKNDYDEIKSIEDDFNYIDDIYRLRKIFYNKYIDFAKKCSEYLKNRDSISGYGKYDILKIKIEDICKKVDNNFPYGWK